MLGVMKFRFPNKHDVYMHDTPTKNLFNAEVRMFSHGCVRVREPQREIFLAQTGGRDVARIGAAMTGIDDEHAQRTIRRRAAGPGFYFLLEGPSIDAVRERIDTTLPFVIENLATLDYDEIYEI